LGELESAAEHARRAMQMSDEQLRNPLIGATARLRRAAATLLGGEPAQAERLAHESLGTAVEHGFRPLLFPLLDVLAGVAVALESYEEGARILGAAERVREEIGHVRWEHEQRLVDALHARVRSELGDENAAGAFESGRAMSSEEAIGWLRRARGTRKRPAGGWESLTPTELKVASLASQGLTNPEIAKRMFISRGTVKGPPLPHLRQAQHGDPRRARCRSCTPRDALGHLSESQIDRQGIP
jgi:Bacterial regulatory proteins, luxR family